MSPPASFSFRGQATKQATVNWSITDKKKHQFMDFLALVRSLINLDYAYFLTVPVR